MTFIDTENDHPLSFCGSVVPDPLTLHGQVLIHFHSDQSMKGRGFRIRSEIIEEETGEGSMCSFFRFGYLLLITIPQSSGFFKNSEDPVSEFLVTSEDCFDVMQSEYENKHFNDFLRILKHSLFF